MAPECLAYHPYNLKADVYTFSIVLHEMLSGHLPYAFARNPRQLINFVVIENGRPDINETWPISIRSMLENSFDKEVEMRPVSAHTLKWILSISRFFLISVSPLSVALQSPNNKKMKLWLDCIRKELVWVRGGDSTGLSDSRLRARRTQMSMIGNLKSSCRRARESDNNDAQGLEDNIL